MAHDDLLLGQGSQRCQIETEGPGHHAGNLEPIAGWVKPGNPVKAIEQQVFGTHLAARKFRNRPLALQPGLNALVKGAGGVGHLLACTIKKTTAQ